MDEGLALHVAYMLLRDPLLLLDELLHNPSDTSTYLYDVSEPWLQYTYMPSIYTQLKILQTYIDTGSLVNKKKPLY